MTKTSEMRDRLSAEARQNAQQLSVEAARWLDTYVLPQEQSTALREALERLKQAQTYPELVAASSHTHSLVDSLNEMQKGWVIVATVPVTSSESIAFSPCGELLASVGWNGTELWNVIERPEVPIRLAPTDNACIAFGPYGDHLAIRDWKSICIWGIANLRELQRLTAHKESVSCVAFSHDGRLVASGDCDGTVLLWDVYTERVLHRWERYGWAVSSLAFSSEGRRLASVTSHKKESELQVRDVTNGSQLSSRSVGWPFAFSRTGRQAIYSEGDGSGYWHSLRLMDVDGSTRMFLERIDYPYCMAFSPDERMIAIGCHGELKLCDITTGCVKYQLKLDRHKGHPESIAFSPDGQFLVTAMSYEKPAYLWRQGFPTKAEQVAYTEQVRQREERFAALRRQRDEAVRIERERELARQREEQEAEHRRRERIELEALRAQRRAARQCEDCGNPLGIIDKLSGQTRCGRCREVIRH